MPAVQDHVGVAEAPLHGYGEGVTDVEVRKFTYKWTINNFSYLFWMKKGEHRDSPFFWVAGGIWQLRLYPNGNEGSQRYLSLYLVLDSEVQRHVHFSLNLESPHLQSQSPINQSKGPVWVNKENRITGFQQMVSVDQFEKFTATEDVAVIKCKMTIFMGVKEPSTRIRLETGPEHDFGGILASGELADFIIQCGEKTFPCHKAILAARSPVFAAMFRHNMKEAKEDKTTLEEDPEIVALLLEFIYTGQVQQMSTNRACELLVAADKYGFNHLKDVCEDALKKSLSEENVCNIMTVADMVKSKELSDVATDFVKGRNLRKVIASKGWESVETTHPHLLLVLLKAHVNG
jgi:speckle-type POZ protein